MRWIFLIGLIVSILGIIAATAIKERTRTEFLRSIIPEGMFAAEFLQIVIWLLMAAIVFSSSGLLLGLTRGDGPITQSEVEPSSGDE